MIKDNSKKIVKGDTFIAIKGINDDGHNYIEEAIKNGAIYSKILVSVNSFLFAPKIIAVITA